MEPVVIVGAVSSAFSTAAWVFYCCYRLRVKERQHKAELETIERLALLGVGVRLWCTGSTLSPPGVPVPSEAVVTSLERGPSSLPPLRCAPGSPASSREPPSGPLGRPC